MPAALGSRVLVIKLGALGDFIQAFGPFAAIRDHHRDAEVVLLTTAPYVAFARTSGLFDEIWDGGRPGAWDLFSWAGLRRRLRGGGFSRVYDLQTSDRSSFYLRLFWPGPGPEWSGIAPGCSHPHANPGRDFMHTVERQAEQLAMAGIDSVPAPDFAWAAADVSGFALPERYALLVPGGGRDRPQKRWPPERFGEIARVLAARQITPVLLGDASESPLMAAIKGVSADAVDLSGRTALMEVAALGRAASLALGNDSGPMHLLAAVGCPSLVLYSHASDPALCGQRGASVTVLRQPAMADISVDAVLEALAL